MPLDDLQVSETECVKHRTISFQPLPFQQDLSFPGLGLHHFTVGPAFDLVIETKKLSTVLNSFTLPRTVHEHPEMLPPK